MYRGKISLILSFLLASTLTCQSFAIQLSAQSSVLVEQSSGRILYESGSGEERLIASITKIMTALVAIEHGDLHEVYTVTQQDMAEGSSMYLRVGEKLTLEELLYGLMLASGNDAALAVAHCVSGSVESFVALMNDTARSLGMTHSSFANPNGLDAQGHYSTALDMARLASHALESETFRRLASTISVTIAGRELYNHNKLLKLCEGCLGLKTGYTRAAGRTLVSAVQREGMTLVCVTLKAPDDWNDHVTLYDFGFDAYHMESPVAAGQKMAQVIVSGGTKSAVLLAARHELSYPVKDGEELTLCVVAPVSTAAPVACGQVLGTVYAYLNGTEVASVELVAMEAVSGAGQERHEGFWKKILH